MPGAVRTRAGVRAHVLPAVFPRAEPAHGAALVDQAALGPDERLKRDLPGVVLRPYGTGEPAEGVQPVFRAECLLGVPVVDMRGAAPRRRAARRETRPGYLRVGFADLIDRGEIPPLLHEVENELVAGAAPLIY